MDFEKFKSSNITISVELYLEEHNEIDPSNMGLEASTRYVSIYPPNQILEIHENGDQTIKNKDINSIARLLHSMLETLYLGCSR